MEKRSSHHVWKFFALLFGGLLAGAIAYYVYKQQNPQYDPWEEPWENSSSPIDLDLENTSDQSDDLAVDEDDDVDETDK